MKTPATVLPFSPYQKFVIFILAITQFSVILDFMIMSPLGDMLMKSMNLTTTQFGMAVSAYAISAGLSGLLTAGFADRFDRKKLLLFFYTGFIVGTIFCGLASTYWLLISARIFTGIFGGVIGSISMAIITDLFDIHHRGRVMGFIQMGFGASQVMGIPISLYIANHWGWQSPFMMVAGLATLIAVLIFMKLEPVTRHLAMQNERNAFQHLWHTISKRHHRMGFLTTALLSLGGFMMMPFGSAFAINNLGVSNEQLPLLFMLTGVGTLVIMPIIGKLSDKIDKFKLFTVSSLLMMVMVVLYTNLAVTPFWLVSMLNIILMMAVMSRMVPSMALVSAIPDMADRGAFMSINSSLQQIAGGFAAAFAGIIVVQKDKYSPLQHYNTLGFIIIAITILCIYMLFRVSVMAKSKLKQEKL
ncbi:MAG: MFS transporter [Taibaiella sp.]|nr:MFS transporter [Taibaiella sp.]